MEIVVKRTTEQDAGDDLTAYISKVNSTHSYKKYFIYRTDEAAFYSLQKLFLVLLR